MKYEFRSAIIEDLDGVMGILQHAKAYMKANHLDQWKNGYPDEDDISDDMKRGCSYILLHKGNPVGTAAVFFDGEKTYDQIFEGEWKTPGTFPHNRYAAVHRVAITSDYRNTGAAVCMMKFIEDLCIAKGVRSMKIDTHEDNQPMRRFLQKCSFEYCGIIYLENGEKRMAYEKVL